MPGRNRWTPSGFNRLGQIRPRASSRRRSLPSARPPSNDGLGHSRSDLKQEFRRQSGARWGHALHRSRRGRGADGGQRRRQVDPREDPRRRSAARSRLNCDPGQNDADRQPFGGAGGRHRFRAPVSGGCRHRRALRRREPAARRDLRRARPLAADPAPYPGAGGGDCREDRACGRSQRTFFLTQPCRAPACRHRPRALGRAAAGDPG